MDKSQALDSFWNSFDIPAYDTNTVPDDALEPYITYENATDSFENVLPLTASIWYRSLSWVDVSKKADEIARYLYELQPITYKIDGGRMRINKGTPFAQRMSDDSDDMIRRIVLNVEVEFMTAY